MLASEVITRVRSQFGDATGIQISDQDIYNWINDACRDIAYGANINQVKAIASVTAGQYDYTFPTDMLTIFSVSYQGRQLKQLSVQERDKFLESADSSVVQGSEGIPGWYWVWNYTLTLYPTPQTSDISPAQSLLCYYTRNSVGVGAKTDVIDLPLPYLTNMIDRVLQRAYEKDENWQAAQIKQTVYQTDLIKLTEDSQDTNHEEYPHISVSVRDSGSDDGYLGYTYNQ